MIKNILNLRTVGREKYFLSPNKLLHLPSNQLKVLSSQTFQVAGRLRLFQKATPISIKFFCVYCSEMTPFLVFLWIRLVKINFDFLRFVGECIVLKSVRPSVWFAGMDCSEFESPLNHLTRELDRRIRRTARFCVNLSTCLFDYKP